MKKALYIIALILTPALSMAQMKVIESSERKAPSWIGASGANYIVANAQAATMEEAKSAALDNVKKQIIEAVALNIKNESSQTTSQTSSAGGNIDQFKEQFDSRFATQAAKLPFVKGITLAKAEKFFWEKLQDKQTKEVIYGYSILYPFTAGELSKLIAEFNKIDAKMQSQLEAIEQIPSTFTTVEELDNALIAIPVLTSYFFDDTRLARTKGAEVLLRRQYQNITPTLALTKNGQAVCVLSIGERTVTTDRKPTIKSNCATQINYHVENGQTIIDYDDSGCMDSEDNYLDVSYRLGGASVKQRLFFDINANKLTAQIQGTAQINFAKTEGNDTIAQMSITLTIVTAGTPAILENANLTLPIVRTPIAIPGLSMELKEAGVHLITLSTTEPLLLVDGRNALPFMRGNIFLRNTATGTLISIPVNCKYTVN